MNAAYSSHTTDLERIIAYKMKQFCMINIIHVDIDIYIYIKKMGNQGMQSYKY